MQTDIVVINESLELDRFFDGLRGAMYSASVDERATVACLLYDDKIVLKETNEIFMGTHARMNVLGIAAQTT